MSNNLQKIKTIVLVTGLICPAMVFSVSYFVSQTNIYAAHARDTGDSEIDQVKEIRGYKNWAKVNPKPLKLPAPLDMLCRMPTQDDLIQTSRNPHRQKYFTVYVNDIGRRAMLTEKTPKFPEGTVIVKEKLLSEDGASKPELLTVMIKQKKGFNSETGDWEYMVVSGTATRIEGRGNLENCRSCHVLNKQTDYVFRNYLPDAVKNELK